LSRRHLLSGMASLGMLAGAPQALAQKRVQIPEGEFVPLPIALPNFVAGTPSDGEVSIGVTQVITNNLKRSGLFAPIDQAAYIEKIVNIDALPQFQNWRTISAQALSSKTPRFHQTDGVRHHLIDFYRNAGEGLPQAPPRARHRDAMFSVNAS
jgi:Tol biopolymer transport system component